MGANVAALSGRLTGLNSKGPAIMRLVVESLMLLVMGVFTAWEAVTSRVIGSEFPFTAFNLAISFMAFFVFWSNFLLMRNDHSAQSSCCHSVMLPCPVTTQIMWLSIQL